MLHRLRPYTSGTKVGYIVIFSGSVRMKVSQELDSPDCELAGTTEIYSGRLE